MAIDAVHIKQQAQDVGSEAISKQANRKSQIELALDILHRIGDKEAYIWNWLESGVLPDYRLALPFHEPVEQSFNSPNVTSAKVRIATDGSQISPDKDAPVDYALLNYGAIKFNGQADSQPYCQSDLLTGCKLFWEGEQIDSDYLELLRDVKERTLALELLEEEKTPQIVLFDGGIELFRQPGGTPGKQGIFTGYLNALEEYVSRGALFAGYIDVPRSGMFLRMLEQVEREEDLFMDYDLPLFPAISDYDLFAAVLKPGQRSAVFEVCSPGSRYYQGELQVMMFYVNASPNSYPEIARVEVPRVIAENQELLSLLHATIIEDSRVTDGYPYSLLRAHEEAVVTWEDKKFIEASLCQELLKHGIKPRRKSRKGHLKGIV